MNWEWWLKWENIIDLVTKVIPLISLVIGLGIWIIQSRIEKLRKVQEQLREDQKRIYLKLLEPFIRVLTGSKVEGESEKAVEQIKSFEYKMLTQEMYYFANDKVILAFNDMMQYFYKIDSVKPVDPVAFMNLWGNLTLQIRYALGNKESSLENDDMLRGWINDIDKYIPKKKRN